MQVDYIYKSIFYHVTKVLQINLQKGIAILQKVCYNILTKVV